MTQPYKIKLTGPGLNVDRAISESLAQQIVVMSMGGAPIPGVTSHGGAAAPASPRGVTHDVSIAEYLNASQAKRSPDKIAAIAVYLRDHAGKSTFAISDLKKGFEDAAEGIPGNLPRDINWTKRLGWIAPKAGQRGAYYVTGTGAQAVASKFSADVVKKTGISRGKRRAKGIKAKTS